MGPVDKEIENYLNNKLDLLEQHFGADVIEFFGPLIEGIDERFKKHVEDIKSNPRDGHTTRKLVLILTTPGGSAEAVERIVNVLRYHYEEVNFVIPDYAYSAGTILCMSGDNIYMDYYSVLGPIDPQVQNKEGRLVAALGYLDKANELIEKAQCGELTDAEFLILKDLDLAELRAYEQSRDLTIALLKKWLVNYKFRNWNIYTSTGKPVTLEEKEARAEEIARELGKTSKWHTHSRPISIKELTEMNLRISDYSDDTELKSIIDQYYSVLIDYIRKYNLNFHFHTRRYI